MAEVFLLISKITRILHSCEALFQLGFQLFKRFFCRTSKPSYSMAFSSLNRQSGIVVKLVFHSAKIYT